MSQTFPTPQEYAGAAVFIVDESGVPITTGGSIATGQATVGTSATEIVAARAGRKSVTIVNESTTVVRLGASDVTTSTGLYLAGTAGASITIVGGAAVYGIVGSSTEAVSYVEVY